MCVGIVVRTPVDAPQCLAPTIPTIDCLYAIIPWPWGDFAVKEELL